MRDGANTPVRNDISRHRLDWGRRGLSERSKRVALAVIETVLCDEDDEGRLVPGRPEACARAVAWLDDSLGGSTSDLRRGFAVLAFFMEWLPLFMIGAPSRATRLPLDRRLAYLEALEASRIGWLSMLLVSFKVPLGIPAFEVGEELALTGFDRPSTVARRKLPVTMGGDPPNPPAQPVSSRPVQPGQPGHEAGAES